MPKLVKSSSSSPINHYHVTNLQPHVSYHTFQEKDVLTQYSRFRVTFQKNPFFAIIELSIEHILNNNFENGRKMTKIMIIKNEIGIPFLNGTSFSFSSSLFCKGRWCHFRAAIAKLSCLLSIPQNLLRWQFYLVKDYNKSNCRKLQTVKLFTCKFSSFNFRKWSMILAKKQQQEWFMWKKLFPRAWFILKLLCIEIQGSQSPYMNYKRVFLRNYDGFSKYPVYTV